MKMKSSNFLIVILFAIFLIGILAILNSQYLNPWIRSQKFDADKWKKEERRRYRMVNDIIDNRLMIGKTKEEIILLLGQDFEEGTCKDCIGYSTNEPDQGFSIDHEVLEIDFNSQNKVISARLNAW